MKKCLWIVLLLLGSILGYAATKPDHFHVERSLMIPAPAARIFPLIADFSQWRLWSPYEQIDPSMTRTLSTPSSGVGARYAWSGNDQVGQGSMEIITSTPPSEVHINLIFLKPMEGQNRVWFSLTPVQGGTRVQWAMEGPMPYLAKLFTLVFDMDAMIGNEYEKGLSQIKLLVTSNQTR